MVKPRNDSGTGSPLASCPLPQWSAVRTRLIGRHERPFATSETSLPLVIEPAGFRDPESLARFLIAESSSIKSALYELLHAGMPGFGEREIHIMMCDPIAIPLAAPPPPGILAAKVADRSYETLDESLQGVELGELRPRSRNSLT